MNNIPFDDITYVSLDMYRNNPIANIRWYLNRYCNFECSYCWPNSHQKEKDFLKKEEYLITVHELIRQFSDNGFPWINWGFGGGEVTFNPSYLDILEEIQMYCDSENKIFMMTNLITNLSQSMKWWDKFISNTKKFYRCKVNASLHKEYVNTEQKRKLFRDKLIHLRNSNSVQVEVNTVLIPGDFENTKKDVDFFNEKNLSVNVKVCRAHGKIIEGYSKEELQYIKDAPGRREVKGPTDKNFLITKGNEKKPILATYLKDKNNNEYRLRSPEQLLVSNYASYIGWDCTAGYQSVTIREDGNIQRGTSCKREEVLGNIRTGFSLYNKPQKCIQTRVCDCVTDLKMPKFRELI